MYVRKKFKLKVVFLFSWKFSLQYAAYSSFIFFSLFVLFPRFDGLPFAIVSVTGIAVAFYVGFKNNSSYERLWEARKIWGSYVNSSRTFAMYVLDFIKSNNAIGKEEVKALQQKIIRRHIAYLASVRFQLRQQTVWKIEEVGNKIVSNDTNFTLERLDEELSRYMPDEEVDFVLEQNNPAVHIIKLQNEDLQNLYSKGCMSDIHHVEMARMLADFINQQGACERIKGFPFPRQYAYYSRLFVYLLIGILPFSLYSELNKLNERITWMTIPVSIILGWIFHTMEVVGDSSENPFENAINDVPITAISRTIEIDLLQLLRETEVPNKIRSENDILM